MSIICSVCEESVPIGEWYGITKGADGTDAVCYDCAVEDWAHLKPEEKLEYLGLVPRYAV